MAVDPTNSAVVYGVTFYGVSRVPMGVRIGITTSFSTQLSVLAISTTGRLFSFAAGNNAAYRALMAE